VEEETLTLFNQKKPKTNQPNKEKKPNQMKHHHHPQNKNKTKALKTTTTKKPNLFLIIVKICPEFFSRRQNIWMGIH